jgi:hypothetical protein
MIKGNVYLVLRRNAASGKIEEADVVTIGPTVAKRAVYQGDIVFHEDVSLALFKDPVTERVYATPFATP